MNLDVGIGVGAENEFTPMPRAEICLDRFRPRNKLQVEFIQADAHHLPFRDKVFDKAFAYNLLEHIQNPWSGMAELARVSNITLFRQDHILHFGNYLEDSHLWFTLPGLRFLKYPRTQIGIGLSNYLRRFWDLKINEHYFIFFPLRWLYNHGAMPHNVLWTYTVRRSNL